MNKPNIRFIDDVVKVKNAKLVYDYRTDQYSLIHYDTEILRINKISENIQETEYRYEIEFALKCSNSSTRAIYQATDFLGIDRQEVQKKLRPYNNFVKYKMSTNYRLKKSAISEMFV